jgi:FkbM family methyltransferase
VGANVGYFTVFAATIANRGHVHAFEVDPRLAAIIHSHFEDDANADTGRVRVVCGAVGDTDGTVASFSPTQSNNLSTNAIEERHGSEGFASPTLTLDTYCESQGVSPDAIKIDVEGFESHVVDGGSAVIEGIDTMFVEMHPDNLSTYGRSVKELLSDLDDRGFTCRQFVDHRGTGAVDESLTPVSVTEPPSENCMVLCTR